MPAIYHGGNWLLFDQMISQNTLIWDFYNVCSLTQLQSTCSHVVGSLLNPLPTSHYSYPFFTMDVCLCGAILNLKAYLFRSDSRYNDRVDSLLECATKYVVITVAQWNRNQIVRGLWLLARKKVEDGFMLMWCNFKFDDVLFNLDTYRRM